MKLIFIFILALSLSVVSSCQNKEVIDKSNIAFKDLLEKGYTHHVNGEQLIMRHTNTIYSCLYGAKPNDITKKTVLSFFNLLQSEFKYFTSPLFVSTRSSCPDNTSIYINIHEGDISSTINEWYMILGSKGLKFQEWQGFSSLGSIVA